MSKNASNVGAVLATNEYAHLAARNKFVLSSALLRQPSSNYHRHKHLPYRVAGSEISLSYLTALHFRLYFFLITYHSSLDYCVQSVTNSINMFANKKFFKYLMFARFVFF
jgi:hypothetical protein